MMIQGCGEPRLEGNWESLPAASAERIWIAQICQMPKLIRTRQKEAQHSTAC